MTPPARAPASETRIDARTALCRAAAELFAERGADAVSVREIARRAGVNHGLVHRHFGSKEALRVAAMEWLAEEIRGQVLRFDGSRESGTELFQRIAEHDAYWRSLARAVLDGEDPAAVQDRFPLAEQLLEKAPSGAKGRPARIEVALVLAMGLGWLLFEPYLVRASGLEEAPIGKIRAEVVARFAERLAALPAPRA